MSHRIKRRMSSQKFYMIARKYGVTEKEWKVVHRYQDARCAICLVPEEELKAHHLYLDHDHVTGEPRGLLCAGCNTLLGCAADSVEILNRALAYLKNPYWNRVLEETDPKLAEEARERQKELSERLSGAKSVERSSKVYGSPAITEEERERIYKQSLRERAKALGLIP